MSDTVNLEEEIITLKEEIDGLQNELSNCEEECPRAFAKYKHDQESLLDRLFEIKQESGVDLGGRMSVGYLQSLINTLKDFHNEQQYP